ncbi:MAG TPA: 16S rRNA pseudouridine(516) synthase [Cellvibrio sp.]|nr:16S rRNA pseudouridine(516) synthase [Cellvibrio sp.]
MQSKCARLDRFISVKTGINRKQVRALLAQSRVAVDGCWARDIHQSINEFTHITLDGQVLQAKTPVYVMMNKPLGVVSATLDAKNKTVIEVLNENLSDAMAEAMDTRELHIVGRLDFNTSGLLLLTNDGRWSRRVTAPEQKIAKLYRVTLANPIAENYIQAFAEGMYFPYEDITTKPAKLEIISDYVAEVSLVEGRYHQIKRMFGRFQNPVVELQRLAIGNVMLDPALAAGESRMLSAWEVENIG